MIRRSKKKIISTVLAIAMLCMNSNIVYADDYNDYYDEDGIESDTDDYGRSEGAITNANFPFGGYNSFEGTQIETEAQAMEMEKTLVGRNYELASTDARTISEHEYELLMKYGSWYSDYAKNNLDRPFNMQFYRVYVYRPVFDVFISEAETGEMTSATMLAMTFSTVVISYDSYYYERLAFTEDDEFNDNIPDFYNSGYLEINSPMNVEVTLLSMGTSRYYKFYVSGGTPFMVKLKFDTYKVTEINTVELPSEETSLKYRNIFTVGEKQKDRDHPIVIDIAKTVYKYQIPEADISGKPDLSLDKNQNIPEERTVVDEEALKNARKKAAEEKKKEEAEQEKLANETDEEREARETEEKKQAEKKTRMLFAGAVTVAGVIIWTIINKIRNRKEKDEDEDVET